MPRIARFFATIVTRDAGQHVPSHPRYADGALTDAVSNGSCPVGDCLTLFRAPGPQFQGHHR